MAICTGKWVLFLISNLASSVDDGAAATMIIEVNKISDNKNIFLLIFTVLLLKLGRNSVVACAVGEHFFHAFSQLVGFAQMSELGGCLS